MTHFTPKPTVEETPTIRVIWPSQACNPDANTRCWCLDAENYRKSSYCSPCEQNGENVDVCVCNNAGQCYPTAKFVMDKVIEIQGTASVEPNVVVKEQIGSNSNSNSNSDGMILLLAFICRIVHELRVFYSRFKIHCHRHCNCRYWCRRGHGRSVFHHETKVCLFHTLRFCLIN